MISFSRRIVALDFVLQRYGTFFDYPKYLNDRSDFFRFFLRKQQRKENIFNIYNIKRNTDI